MVNTTGGDAAAAGRGSSRYSRWNQRRDATRTLTPPLASALFMDYLWSPWRYQYVTAARPRSACIFCEYAASNNDRENLVVYRGQRNFILLNRFPYTSGHVMIAPYEHVDTAGSRCDGNAGRNDPAVARS